MVCCSNTVWVSGIAAVGGIGEVDGASVIGVSSSFGAVVVVGCGFEESDLKY